MVRSRSPACCRTMTSRCCSRRSGAWNSNLDRARPDMYSDRYWKMLCFGRGRIRCPYRRLCTLEKSGVMLDCMRKSWVCCISGSSCDRMGGCTSRMMNILREVGFVSWNVFGHHSKYLLFWLFKARINASFSATLLSKFFTWECKSLIFLWAHWTSSMKRILSCFASFIIFSVSWGKMKLIFVNIFFVFFLEIEWELFNNYWF